MKLTVSYSIDYEVNGARRSIRHSMTDVPPDQVASSEQAMKLLCIAHVMKDGWTPRKWWEFWRLGEPAYTPEELALAEKINNGTL